MVMSAVAATQSQATALYSFETLYNTAVPPQPDPLGTRPDGYHNNGGGTTVVRDTIGTTDGSFSLKFTQVAGQTFSAAITEVLTDIATINHVNTFAVSLDVTVPSTGAYAGNFARIGITEFGNNSTLTGQPAQTIANAEQFVELTPGTYRITIPLIARTNNADPEFATDVPFSQCFGPDDSRQLTTPTSFQFYVNKFNDQPLTLYYDNVQVVPVGRLSHWNNFESSDWSNAANWLGGVPSGAGVNATFGSAIARATTVNVDSPRTLGQIDFNNGSGYTLSGTSAITIDTTGGADGAINQFNGAHAIQAPLILNKNTTFRVAPPTSTLLVSNLTATGRAVTKTGAGTLAVNRVRGSGLTISAGTVRIIAASDPHVPGADASVSNVGSVSIAPTARLDLTNTKLITNTAPGSASGGVYNGLQGEAQRAYDFNAWDQPGLMTSQADALAGLTTIGIATGAQMRGLGPTDTDLFGGQTITGASTIAMYTYAGDANLDGVIDGGDYGTIDNFVQVPGADGYANGDFNYDGVIDGGDYGVIDNNIQAQGPGFATSGSAVSAGLVVAVPEPVGLSIVALVSAALRAQRRRRRT
jgi:hypothetical protein